MDLKRANQVFPVLQAWYNNNYLPQTEAATPTKKKKRSRLSSGKAGNVSKRPPLIVILEDFEGFASHILQDFILNLV